MGFVMSELSAKKTMQSRSPIPTSGKVMSFTKSISSRWESNGRKHGGMRGELGRGLMDGREPRDEFRRHRTVLIE